MDIVKNDKEPITLHTANKYCKEDINIIIETEELTVTPTAEEQVFDGLYNTVTVGAISYEESGTVTPEQYQEAETQISDLFGEEV